MLWAKAQGPAVLRAYTGITYERFWKRELDVEDLAVIEGVLEEAGARTIGFRNYATGEGRALHDAIQHAAFDAGIFGVPTYIIDREMFFGREHLPRIRWMLTGRHGAPPDTAYEDISAERAREQSSLPFAIDFKNPYAYLATAPTCALADELGIAIDWLPMALSQGNTPGPANTGTIAARVIVASAPNTSIAMSCAMRRIVASSSRTPSGYRFDGRAQLVCYGPSGKAHRLRAHTWSASSSATGARLSTSKMSARSRHCSRKSAPQLRIRGIREKRRTRRACAVQSELRDAGVFEVPSYLVNGEVYLGRSTCRSSARCFSADLPSPTAGCERILIARGRGYRPSKSDRCIASRSSRGRSFRRASQCPTSRGTSAPHRRACHPSASL